MKAPLLEHSSDGIEELDNPMPRWWLALFFVTIAFAIGYATVYPTFWFYRGTAGWTSSSAYEKDVAAHPAPAALDYKTINLDQLAKDPASVAAGQAIFAKNCSPCHGDNLEGKIGPCLTDSEWRYGGKDIDILTSISKGRPGGMPVWGKVLKPADIVKVASFVRSRYTGAPPAKK